MDVPTLAETQLAENVWVFTLGGETIQTSFGANCTAVVGRDSVLLVDPLIAPAYARAIERAVRKRTSTPVRFVVLTHHHTDHALGAGHFAARGAFVLSHPACRERMAAEHAGLISERRGQPEIADLFRDAEPYLPSVIFEERLSLDLGGSLAHIRHPGHGHAPGDAVVDLPRESIAICGDLVSSGYHVNYEDAAVERLDQSLDFLRALGALLHVPGHGAPGGPELIEEQARYHATVKAAAAEASGEEDLAERMRESYPEHLLGLVLRVAFAAWSSKLQPPDPGGSG